MTNEHVSVIIDHMTIYDEIIKLRISTNQSLSHVCDFPKLTEYGFMYTATIIANGVAHSEVFKYNPSTYAKEGMDDLLKTLIIKSGLVEQECLSSVECTEGTLEYLLDNDFDDNRHYKRYHNGLTVADDRKKLTMPGTAIRYTLKVAKGTRTSYNNWKNFDESVVIYINAFAEWKDPESDKQNEKIINEWLVSTAKDVAKAKEYITALDALVTKALSNK